jgi:hypothetical protein
MDAALKAALGGTVAIAGFAGAKNLQKQAVQQYRTEGLRETGAAVKATPNLLGGNLYSTLEDSRKILSKFTEQTGVKPNVTVNTSPAGASYSSATKNAISLNYPFASKFTLGHELGHQSINIGGGAPDYIQRNLYTGLNPNVVGLATIGVSAMAPSTRRATGLALAMNYLNNSGRIFSEIEATRRGTNLLNQAGVPVSAKPGMYQVAGYALAPAATALAGVGVGRFLRAFAEKVSTPQAAQAAQAV